MEPQIDLAKRRLTAFIDSVIEPLTKEARTEVLSFARLWESDPALRLDTAVHRRWHKQRTARLLRRAACNWHRIMEAAQEYGEDFTESLLVQGRDHLRGHIRRMELAEVRAEESLNDSTICPGQPDWAFYIAAPDQIGLSRDGHRFALGYVAQQLALSWLIGGHAQGIEGARRLRIDSASFESPEIFSTACFGGAPDGLLHVGRDTESNIADHRTMYRLNAGALGFDLHAGECAAFRSVCVPADGPAVLVYEFDHVAFVCVCASQRIGPH